MQALAFLAALLLPSVFGESSIILKNSEVENYNSKLVSSSEKFDINYRNSPSLELIIDLKNFSHVSIKEKKKPRKERIPKRKDKGEKYFRPRNRFQKPMIDDFERNTLRNNEKATLLRNKTIEILKNGLKILSTSESYTQNGNKSNSRINETLLEKILSSAVSKQDVLLSATGIYQLPVGFEIYKTKTSLPANSTPTPFPEENLNGHQTKRLSKKHQKSSSKDYDYELVSNFNFDTLNDSKISENFDYETLNDDKTVGILFEKIVQELRNLTNGSKESCPSKNETDFEDSCQKWLDCGKTLDRAFIGDINNLPSCPCTYPSFIFYEEMIWDKIQKKYFRWRDASNEAERLDIYKPGAAYCIRSLLTQGSLSVSSQQCCYDRSLQLITRGSGAGTINFISPDISKKLHYTVDILPWRLCKGDFTRYNIARYPNNGNNCSQNPHEEQYQLQSIEKHFDHLEQGSAIVFGLISKVKHSTSSFYISDDTYGALPTENFKCRFYKN